MFEMFATGTNTRMHASVLATGQLRHQSATAPSHAIHMRRMLLQLAAQQCQQIWPHTHVAE